MKHCLAILLLFISLTSFAQTKQKPVQINAGGFLGPVVTGFHENKSGGGAYLRLLFKVKPKHLIGGELEYISIWGDKRVFQGGSAETSGINFNIGYKYEYNNTIYLYSSAGVALMRIPGQDIVGPFPNFQFGPGVNFGGKKKIFSTDFFVNYYPTAGLMINARIGINLIR
ncbi:MAG: hypothetical protein ABL872_01605 [Lacibacter sp.]